MSKNKGEIRFIRKHGRIIPIRVKTDKQMLKRGLMTTALGFGSVTGTAFADDLIKMRIKSGEKARETASRLAREFRVKRGYESRKIPGIAAKLKKRTGLLKLFAAKTSLSQLFNTALVGAGVTTVLRSTGRDGLNEESEIGAGVIAAFAVAAGARSKIARKLLSKSHRFISKRFSMTSELNRTFVEKRTFGQQELFGSAKRKSNLRRATARGVRGEDIDADLRNKEFIRLLKGRRSARGK